MKPKLIDILKFVIGWPLSFIALYFVFTTFAKQTDGVTLAQNINYPMLIPAFICFILYYILRSYIWLKLLHFLGHHIPFRDSSFLWLSAQLKRYIPGNIWSYVGLAVSYNERNVPKKDIAYAVLIETELVIIVTFILSLLCLPLILTEFIIVPWDASLLLLLLSILFTAGTVLYIFISTLVGKRRGKLFTVIRHLFSRYTPLENFKLLLLMGGTYLLYAFGYYFSVASVHPLDPELLLVFLGIFNFALVAGYLSFFTPTGLGVREGFIALGLAKFIPIGVAGFAALFSRVLIVIAELITLFLSYMWFKAGKKWKKYEDYISSHLHEILLGAGIVLYIVYFTILSFLRYTNYYTGRFDLGNMAQTVWNTSQGRIFMISDPNGTETVSRLAFHADFILVLLAPFYLLWSDPRILLLIQTVVVAFGAYFLYKISREILSNKTVSIIIALSFLLNPSVQRANIYDFHAVVLATTFLLAAVFFLMRKKYLIFFVFAVLAALTKEQLWFVIALFGPLLYFSHRKKLQGILLSIFSLGMFYYLLWHAIPDAAGSAHFALSYFSEGGSSPSDILKRIIFSPGDSITTAFQEDRLAYYQKLLLPVGYLPLAFPFWLIFAAPDLVLNIFSDRSQLQQIYYQYTAVISSFLFLSVIYGIYTIRKFEPRIPFLFFSSYLTIMTLLGAYLYGPLPGAREANLAAITKPQEDREVLDRMLHQIPLAASVSASNNIASHLSERERIYVIPNGIGQADYVVIYKGRSNTNAKDSEILTDLRNNPIYEPYFENNATIFFKKR